MTIEGFRYGLEWSNVSVLVLLAVLSIILLSGHGADLIPGNGASVKKEGSGYNKKALSRVLGSGLLIFTILIFVMCFWESVLPAWSFCIALVVFLADVVTVTFFVKTICRKHADIDELTNERAISIENAEIGTGTVHFHK